MEGQATFLQIVCEPLWNTISLLGNRLCQEGANGNDVKHLVDAMQCNVENWRRCSRDGTQLPESLRHVTDFVIDFPTLPSPSTSRGNMEICVEPNSD